MTPDLSRADVRGAELPEADQSGERGGPPHVEILLVSGLHANETCAPLFAREVFRTLSAEVRGRENS